MKQSDKAGTWQFLTWIFIMALPVFSCSNPSAGNNNDRAGNPADTLMISQPSAIFFTADSLQREKLKARLGENPFEGADHECFYQMKNARTSLKEHWPQIRIYEVTDTIVLLFQREDGQKPFIDLRTKNDLCGLYLFNRKQDPVPADMMGIGTSLERYFTR